MSKHKRLFLFAGYAPDGIVNDALVYYIAELSKHGDIVLFMDCNSPKSELNKVQQYCLYAAAHRHCEYDFGSYKRAFQYAKEQDILKNYENIYLVNDSVYGPMINILPTLQRIENCQTDASGLVISHHRTHSYMESWFIRLNSKIFMSKWFDSFISSVTQQADKTFVTIKYEHGLSNLIKEHGYTWDGVYHVRGRYTYNHPKQLFLRGCPFIKKVSFIRHNGAIGNQIKYILAHSDAAAREAVIKTANVLHGEKYMRNFLTRNPIKIMARKITYVIYKLKGWRTWKN